MFVLLLLSTFDFLRLNCLFRLLGRVESRIGTVYFLGLSASMMVDLFGLAIKGSIRVGLQN
jgi:hypothetical protein